MRYVSVLVVLGLVFGSGCSTLGDNTAAGGGASYTLKKAGDGCSITVNSSREVGGATVVVEGDTCSMTAEVDSLEAIPISPEFLKILLNR